MKTTNFGPNEFAGSDAPQRNAAAGDEPTGHNHHAASNCIKAGLLFSGNRRVKQRSGSLWLNDSPSLYLRKSRLYFFQPSQRLMKAAMMVAAAMMTLPNSGMYSVVIMICVTIVGVVMSKTGGAL